MLSRSFWFKTFSQMAGFGSIIYAASKVPALALRMDILMQQTHFLFLDAAEYLAWWSLLAMFASACCLLQLLLNLLSIGCAGFNTTLGPWRPTFMAVMLLMQIFQWRIAAQRFDMFNRALLSTAISVTLAALPEMLYVKNFLWKSNVSATSEGEKVAAAVAIVLKTEDMGCIACVDTVRNCIVQLPKVISCDVSFESKLVSVTCEGQPSDEETQKLAAQVVDAMEDIGFSATLQDITSNEGTTSSEGITSSEDTTSSEGITSNEDTTSSEGITSNEGTTSSEQSAGANPNTNPNNPNPNPDSNPNLNPDQPGAKWRWVASAMAGLLSSSCCLVQLGLNLLSTMNVLHVGCAGFNKVLGPVRSIFRGITGAGLVCVWSMAMWQDLGGSKKKVPRSRIRRLILPTITTLVLMFLPELLKHMGGPKVAPPMDSVDKLVVTIDNMGCEACQYTVQGLIDRTDGVVASNLDFATGIAEIFVARDWGFDAKALEEELMYQGYTLLMGTGHETVHMRRLRKIEERKKRTAKQNNTVRTPRSGPAPESAAEG